MSILQSFFTNWLSGYDDVLIFAYLAVFIALALYGFHRSTLVYLYYRYRDRRPEPLGRLPELLAPYEIGVYVRHLGAVLEAVAGAAGLQSAAAGDEIDGAERECQK